MARSKQKHSKKVGTPSSKSAINWKRKAKQISIVLAFFACIGFSLAAFSHFNQVKQDLSVVGNGTPTVVQIHDPNCSLCARLKRNLDAARGDFADQVQFKVANLSTHSGRDFARKYQAESVTLLFFDERGRLVNRIQGVSSKEQITPVLASLTH